MPFAATHAPTTPPRLTDKGTPHTRWGSRPCPPSPCCAHHCVAWVIPPSLSTMCHGRVWPLPSPTTPHAERPPVHSDRAGGANGARVWPPGPWVGMQGPSAETQEPLALSRLVGGWWGPSVSGLGPRHPPTICLYPGPCPTPTHAAASSPRCPCCVIQAVRAARRAEGPRTAPSAPPPPKPASAKGLTVPGRLLCRGGRGIGRFVLAPYAGLYPRHRAQTPVGGNHPTPHH